MSLDDISGNTMLPSPDKLDGVRSVQLSVVEYYLRGGMSREEMTDLVSMVTPTHEIEVSGLSRLGTSKN